MTDFSLKTDKNINMVRHYLVLAFCWSMIMLAAMGYQMYRAGRDSMNMVRLQAESIFTRDIIHRKWCAAKGGVYAEVSEETPPNPYLDVPERDISTPSGKKLTKINPAYMTRQIHDLEKKKGLIYGHICSLKPINPANSPDPWEKTALERFAAGETEISSIELIDGVENYRFMKPLFVEKSCLRCHGDQGCKVGDIRGGISISIPMQEITAVEHNRLLNSYFIYLALWLLGLVGLGVGTWRLHLLLLKRQETEADLANFKTTLDNINDCVFMFRPDTLRFFYVNQGAVEQVGYSAEELLTMTPLDIKPEFTEEDFRDMITMLVNKERDSLTFETVHWHKSKGGVPVEVTLQYVVPENGKGRCVALVRDITKRKTAREEKEKMQSRLVQSQKMESVGQLAAGIAHEINTPAQYVGSNIDFLDEAFTDIGGLVDKSNELLTMAEKENIPPEKWEELAEEFEEADWEYLAEEIPKAIRQSRDGIKRISTIVQAMKEFSHPGSKEISLNNINHIIKNTVTVARNEWKYVAEVKSGLDPNLPSVPCLADEMGQVFLNIIINAAHAIKEKLGDNPDGEKGTIKIVSRQKDNWVEIAIADSGMGMPDVILDKIFDPFFTTKEVGKGTGQGLAIARDVVESKHGGRLMVKSEMGQGTTFIIRLPLQRKTGK